MSWLSDLWNRNFNTIFDAGGSPAAPSPYEPAAPTPAPPPAPKPDRSGASRSAIADAFASAFGPDFFNANKAAYTGQYAPELDTYYTQEKGRLNAALANRGQTGSSTDLSLNKTLDDLRDTTRNTYETGYNDWAGGVNNAVAAARDKLYGQVNADSDPLALGAQASQTAAGLKSAPKYSSLGDVFAALVNPIAGAGAPQQNLSNALSKAPQAGPNLAGNKDQNNRSTSVAKPAGSGTVVR